MHFASKMQYTYIIQKLYSGKLLLKINIYKQINTYLYYIYSYNINIAEKRSFP